MNDWQIQETALAYVKRSQDGRPSDEATALMQTAALLMIVVELRRIANQVDDARGLR